MLANDFDFDGDPLSVISTTQPGNGQVEINTDGTVTYTPVDGFSGDDCKLAGNPVVRYFLHSSHESSAPRPLRSIAFEYTISDGNGGTAEATVAVSVVELAQPGPNTSKPTSMPTRRPGTDPPVVTTCSDMCFEPLDPSECPICDPTILPSCSDTTLEIDALCETDGECESKPFTW